MSVISEFEGLDGLADYFKRMPDRTARAARLAINTTISRKGMKLIQDEMYDEVAFPKGYLKGDRLFVSKFATESTLQGVILGRKRATSLARFAASGTSLGSKTKAGVSVVVSNGKTQFLRNAWLVKLKGQRKSVTEDQFNVGLAVRLKPGESIRHKGSAHNSWLIKDQVALLYGPSVDQVFSGVAEKTGPQILNLLSDEFFRQFDRIS